MSHLTLTVASLRRPILAFGLLAVWMATAPTSHAAPGTCEATLDQYIQRVWTTEEGLPLDTVHSLAQDPDGFLWAGTEDGLARFDGIEFERIDLTEALGDAPEFITALAVDGAGVINVGTATSGLLRLGHVSPHGASISHSTTHSVHALILGDSGQLLAATRGSGLLQSHPGGQIEEPTTGRLGASVNALAPRKAGGYWVGHAGAGLQLFDGYRFNDVPGMEALSDSNITALLEDSSGILWIGTRTDLFSFDGENLHNENRNLKAPVYALSLMEDSQGTLWVGLGGSGIARRCGDRFDTLSDVLGPSSGRINAILEDHEGSIWLATGGDGLIQLRMGAAVPLTHQHGLPSAPVLPIIQTRDGSMWLGTFGGGLARVNADGLTVIDSGAGLANDRVLSLATDQEDNLWIGTYGGLNRLHAGSIQQSWSTSDGLPHNTVMALLHDGQRLWMGTINGLAMLEGDQLTTFQPDGGFRGYVIHLFKSRDGTLWIGTDGGGLFWLRNGLVQSVPFSRHLPGMVTGVIEPEEGIFWVSTIEGLVRWDGARAVRVGQRQGLPDTMVVSIIDDGLGRLWMSGNQGVFSVDYNDLEAVATGVRETLTALTFTRANGMPRSETNGGFQPAVWRDDRGRLWYPTTDGAATFNPHTLATRVPAPKPVVRRIVRDGQILDRRNDLQLEPRPDWVEFSYSAPTFINTAQVEYQYRLTGFDTNWYTTTDSNAMYRRLPAGSFGFELRARKPRSDWSEPVRIQLQIKRYWLHNPFLWVATSLLMLTMLITVLQRHYQRREVQRERVMQAQKLEAIGLMAGGIAHDFNNVLSSIISGTELLADEFPAGSRQKRLADSILDRTADGAGMVRQLLAFARRQRVEPHWLNLREQVDSFRPFLARLISRDIRLDWQTEPVGYCLTDRTHLQQILINLTLNARDAMPEGGTLKVSLMLREQTDLATLEVADTGDGMSAETQDRIFEPFFTTKEMGKGTGLGLAVTYGIVKQAGGTIEVESAPGVGTRFRIFLPVRPNPPDHIQQRASESIKSISRGS